jgi:hypothetical protein
MREQQMIAMQPLDDRELEACGGWEPANGMQWLGAKAHEAWNHFWAAVEDSQRLCAEAGSTCVVS